MSNDERISTLTISQAFLSHRLSAEIDFFATENRFRATVKGLTPIFFFMSRLGGMKHLNYAIQENANFTKYRRGVLRGKGGDEFWIMAERSIRP